jgi:hypothetical protein
MGGMKNLTDLFRHAAYKDRPLEELQAETAAATPQKLGLPTTWETRDQPAMRGPEASVVSASAEDIESYADPNMRATCGSCQHFNLEGGRAQIIKERFAERLVLEQEWQLKHLAVPTEMLGVCDASNAGSGAELAVTIISRSCDNYRERLTRAGRWRL